MFKLLPILGCQEMKVWHIPEQDCDIVMCHFSRLHYTKILYYYTKMRSIFPIFRNFLEISPDFPQKWTP
jgi:hypothetical protein